MSAGAGSAPSSDSDRCLLPLQLGGGASELRRFYYNPIAKRCIEFLYKGVRGNENNFLTYTDCKRQCMSRLGAGRVLGWVLTIFGVQR